jgi:excisionase family DNA binding protein
MNDLERRRREAVEVGATAPLAKVYAVLIEQLRSIDGTPTPERWMTTAEAAEVLSLSEKTVRGWCGEGRFPGAKKTSGETGRWTIPAREVYMTVGSGQRGNGASPKLWTPEE